MLEEPALTSMRAPDEAAARGPDAPNRGRPVVAAILAVAWLVGALATVHTFVWWPSPSRPFPGFFVMETGIVPTVSLAHWTGRGTVPFHARVVAVDGRPVLAGEEVYRDVAAVPEGRTVRYALEKDGASSAVDVPTMRFGYYDWACIFGVYVLNGLVALAMATVVAMLKPRQAAARAFLMWGVCWGLFPLTGTALYEASPAWLTRLHYLTQAMYGASFIHLGWVFPVERRFVARHRWTLALPYVVGAVLTAWIMVAYYATPPSTVPLHVAYDFSAAGMCIFIATLAYSWWENRDVLARPRALAVLVGGVIATGIGIYGFVDTARAGGSFPINYLGPAPMFFFVAIGYAIVAHDAFEITLVLRRTALYVLLVAALTALYYTGLAVLALLLPSPVIGSPMFTVGFIAVVSLLFQPLRGFMQRAVDAAFLNTRPDYRRTVSRVSAALPSLLALDQILDRVGRTLHGAFASPTLEAWLWSTGTARAWRWDGRADRMQEVSPPAVLERLRALLPDDGRALVLVDEEGRPRDAPVAPLATALGAALAVPIVFASRVQGTFVIGPKRSGFPYDREDIELLETLAAQSAVAIQNALSHEQVASAAAMLEGRVRERTLELERRNVELRNAYQQLAESEKMASLGQLVAGVAHELNNPVSFIAGNVGPTRRRLEELRARLPPDPVASKLLDQVERSIEIIGRGAARTASIVHDLQTFSRGSDGVPEPVDVEELLEFTVTLLKERWDGRITIQRRYGGVPLVEGVASQLGQLFLNLVANACDAIPAKGAIAIATARDGDAVVVTIHDDGVGMSDELRRRIFEPFVTTKPQGKGLGLGLSISRGIVDGHHGRITVESSPGAGSTFRVVLPIRAVVA